jgi:hypothetical protein
MKCHGDNPHVVPVRRTGFLIAAQWTFPCASGIDGGLLTFACASQQKSRGDDSPLATVPSQESVTSACFPHRGDEIQQTATA